MGSSYYLQVLRLHDTQLLVHWHVPCQPEWAAVFRVQPLAGVIQIEIECDTSWTRSSWNLKPAGASEC